jgi:pyruvate dehydrogenase E2 component (dihydrolipoamide acetyltransferase)
VSDLKIEQTTVKASPAAKKLAIQLGINLGSVKGSGPDGRITENDIKSASECVLKKAPTVLKASPAAKKLAKDYGIELREVAGSGPGGRIIEIDVARTIASMKEITPKIRVSPLALKALQEYKVDIDGITGSGVAGKIIKTDVLKAAGISEDREKTTAPTERKEAANLMPVRADDAGYEVMPYTGMRKVIGERMLQSTQSAPHFTLTTELTVEGLVRFRASLNESLKAQGQPGISYTDILVKVVAVALRQHPNINSLMVDGEIRRMNKVNIGVATAIPNGLIVPVVKQADQKTIPEISKEVKDLVARAREGKVVPEEISGSTFTISNLGMYDVDGFTPIINQPECAILGVGRMVEKPVVENGAIVNKPTMVLSMSVDHRAIDGAPGAMFLKDVKSMLQDPFKILLKI